MIDPNIVEPLEDGAICNSCLGVHYASLALLFKVKLHEILLIALSVTRNNVQTGWLPFLGGMTAVIAGPFVKNIDPQDAFRVKTHDQSF